MPDPNTVPGITFDNTPPGANSVPGVTFDNTPPGGNTVPGVTFDNTAPGGNTVPGVTFDNTAPGGNTVPGVTFGRTWTAPGTGAIYHVLPDEVAASLISEGCTVAEAFTPDNGWGFEPNMDLIRLGLAAGDLTIWYDATSDRWENILTNEDASDVVIPKGTELEMVFLNTLKPIPYGAAANTVPGIVFRKTYYPVDDTYFPSAVNEALEASGSTLAAVFGAANTFGLKPATDGATNDYDILKIYDPAGPTEVGYFYSEVTGSVGWFNNVSYNPAEATAIPEGVQFRIELFDPAVVPPIHYYPVS